MIKDNWNLKDKRIPKRLGNPPAVSIDGTSPWMNVEEWCYSEEDIETLRQKLIGDIDAIDCTDKSKLKKWEIIEKVLDIINQRFGVEYD